MNLQVLLPFKVFAQIDDVAEIIAETLGGSLGLLAHRLDCVAALVPGILGYAKAGDGVRYLAIDEGVLVKRGGLVCISARRAIAGATLGELHQAVIREYLTLDAQELRMRAVVAKMESGLIGRLARLRDG